MTRPFTASLWAACAASFLGVGLFYITLSQLGTLNGSDHKYEGTVRIWIIDTLTMFLGGGVEDMESKRTWGLKFYLLLTMTAFWIIVVLYNGQILAALTVVSVEKAIEGPQVYFQMDLPTLTLKNANFIGYARHAEETVHP